MKKSNARKAVEKEWANFARELMEEECPVALFHGHKPDEFGEIMGRLIARDGSVYSVLWDSVVPSGTEDRTWVRSWLSMKGEKRYQAIERGMDGHHAKHCIEKLKSVL